MPLPCPGEVNLHMDLEGGAGSLFEGEEYCGQKEYIAKGTEARNNSVFRVEYNLVWAFLVAQ